jgi:Fe-S-cluster containining protein
LRGGVELETALSIFYIMQNNNDGCSCERCVALCERNPGWMTPEEAEAALDAGLGKRLMRDWLEPSSEVGNDERIYLLCPAAEGYEGGDAPELDFMSLFSAMSWSKGCCTFLEGGRCTVHSSGYKPRQCREAFGCDDIRNKICSDNYAMARLWRNDAARAIVARWQAEISDLPVKSP